MCSGKDLSNGSWLRLTKAKVQENKPERAFVCCAFTQDDRRLLHAQRVCRACKEADDKAGKFIACRVYNGNQETAFAP